MQGISLSVDQYVALLEILPHIESVLESKGITVARPEYAGKTEAATVDVDEVVEEEEEDDDDDEVQERKSSSKLEKYRMKKNHEATSDEDDG